MTAVRLEILSRIAELWAEFPAYNRFVRTAGTAALTPPESHILVEIDSSRRVTAAVLAERLHLDKGGISRLLHGLDRRGLIASERDPANLRRKFLRLTSLGRSQLRKFDLETDQRYDSFVRLGGLGAKDLAKLAGFMTAIAHGFTGNLLSKPRAEHPLRLPIRNLTRELRFLSGSNLRSGMTPLQFQALLFLGKLNESQAVGDLAAILQVPQNTLSQALIALRRMGLVKRAPGGADERFSKSALTRKGRDFAPAIARKTADALAEPVSGLTTAELQNGYLLMERLIHGAALHFWLVSRELTIEELAGNRQIQAARRLLVRHWSGASPDAEIPDRLMAEENRRFGLCTKGRLIAVAEIAPSSSNSARPRIVNLGWEPAGRLHKLQLECFTKAALLASL